MMSPLTIGVIASATGAYAIWGYQSLRKDLKPGEGPSFASLLLWSIIDCIMWWNTARAKNDQVLIGTYTVLTVALTIILFIKKRYGWTKTDTKIAVLTFVCFVASYLTPPVWAVLLGALSIATAGIPNLQKIYANVPTKLLYLTIVCFLLGPTLTLISVYLQDGGDKEYIYPGIAVAYWFIGLIFALKQELGNMDVDSI